MGLTAPESCTLVLVSLSLFWLVCKWLLHAKKSSLAQGGCTSLVKQTLWLTKDTAHWTLNEASREIWSNTSKQQPWSPRSMRFTWACCMGSDPFFLIFFCFAASFAPPLMEVEGVPIPQNNFREREYTGSSCNVCSQRLYPHFENMQWHLGDSEKNWNLLGER